MDVASTPSPDNRLRCSSSDTPSIRLLTLARHQGGTVKLEVLLYTSVLSLPDRHV